MLRILVVDDHAPTVSAMTQLLVDHGHFVAPSTRGSHAVEALARESFDAVVTDLEMPGVDGWEVSRAARLRQPHACLVVVTARTEAADELFAAGACIVADKPVDCGGLLAAIADCRSDGPHAHGGRRTRLRYR